MAVPSAWRFCSACGFNVEKEELVVNFDEITQVGGVVTEIRLTETPTLLANIGQQGLSETAADHKADKEVATDHKADHKADKELLTSADAAGAANQTPEQTPVASAFQLPMAQVEDTTDTAEDTTDTPTKHPLAIAVQLGRYAEANRELLKLEGSGDDASRILDADAIERVKRIGAKFTCDRALPTGEKLTCAQRLLQIKPQDLKANEENSKLKLKWGMKLEGSMMQMVSVTEFDANFLKVLALDLEADLEDKISEDEISQVMFGKAHAHDVSWRKRMVKAGVGTKADDIMMVSAVDALDEPLVEAVCTLKYTLDASAVADPFGNAIPPLAPGHLRTPYVMTATAFTPLGLDGDKMRGVRKVECTEVQLAPTVAKVLGVMPNFMLKKLVRGSVEAKAKLIPEVIRDSEELNKRMQMAPRCEFLEQIRAHIAGKPSSA